MENYFHKVFIFLLISFLLNIITSCDKPEPISYPPFQNHESYTRLDYSNIGTDSLSNKIESLMKKANVHGLAIAIITNNELSYQEHFGSADNANGRLLTPGSSFYGASFSKIVFAYLVMQLVEEGVLNLDTPLVDYLPEPLTEKKGNIFENIFGTQNFDYTDLKNDERLQLITARMCLNHTSGLPNWRWIEEDRKLKIKFDPGSRYSYSGEGIYLLQYVVESVTKRALEDLTKEKVFDPLGMPGSSYIWQAHFEKSHCVGHNGNNQTLGIPKREDSNAAGSLTTTLEDMSSFYLGMLLQHGMKNSSFEEMLSPQIKIHSKQQFGPNAWVDTGENDDITLSYGLGFGLFFTPHGKAFFKEGHDDGWQHYSIAFPEKQTAVIVMTNSDNGESIFKELMELTIANYYTPWYWENFIPYN